MEEKLTPSCSHVHVHSTKIPLGAAPRPGLRDGPSPAGLVFPFELERMNHTLLQTSTGPSWMVPVSYLLAHDILEWNLWCHKIPANTLVTLSLQIFEKHWEILLKKWPCVCLVCVTSAQKHTLESDRKTKQNSSLTFNHDFNFFSEFLCVRSIFGVPCSVMLLWQEANSTLQTPVKFSLHFAIKEHHRLLLDWCFAVVVLFFLVCIAVRLRKPAVWEQSGSLDARQHQY